MIKTLRDFNFKKQTRLDNQSGSVFSSSKMRYTGYWVGGPDASLLGPLTLIRPDHQTNPQFSP